MNTFTFDTRADYLSAKATNGTIYNALQVATDVISKTIVSYIKATGETLIDAMNVFVDRDKGEIGDTLYFITTSSYTGYKWLKSKAGYSSTSYGQNFYRSALIPSSYVEVGVLIRKEGKNGLIMRNTGQGISWTPQSYEGTTIPGVFTSTSNRIGNGVSTTYCSASAAFAEERWGSSYYQYAWPFPRTAWDAMMAKVWANESGSDSDGSNYSWTVTAQSSGGVGVASFTCTGPYGAMGAMNPKDWDYDFDKWYKAKVFVLWPVWNTDKACADMNGRQNTKAICQWALGLSTPLTASNCAALYCNTLAVSNVSDYGAGKWWLPSLGELLCAGRYHAILKKKGTAFYSSSYSIWSSTQYSSSYSWLVINLGNLDRSLRRYDDRVCAVSAFQFN